MFKKIFVLFSLLFILFFSFSNKVLADTTGDNVPTNNTADTTGDNTQNKSGSTVRLDNPLGTVSVPVVIGRVINKVLGIVGALALLMFVYGGITWMTSMGNEQKVTQGKNILMWASLGMVIIFSSYAIIRFILEAIGA